MINTSGIRVGDDITISGTVEEVRSNILLVGTNCMDGVTRRHWVDPAEIKTIRPHGNGG